MHWTHWMSRNLCTSVLNARAPLRLAPTEAQPSAFRSSEPRAAQQPAVNPWLRSLDQHRADRLRIVVRGTDAADDGVAEALLPHRLQAGKQQAGADAAFPHLGRNAGGAEEIAAGR